MFNLLDGTRAWWVGLDKKLILYNKFAFPDGTEQTRAAVQSDWTETNTSILSYIKNKPAKISFESRFYFVPNVNQGRAWNNLVNVPDSGTILINTGGFTQPSIEITIPSDGLYYVFYNI